MAVRNKFKQLQVAGKVADWIYRPVFIGDPANWTPHNEPLADGRSRRLAKNGSKRNAKVPSRLLKGLAHRTHISRGMVEDGGGERGLVFTGCRHGVNPAFTKWVNLTKAYKKNK